MPRPIATAFFLTLLLCVLPARPASAATATVSHSVLGAVVSVDDDAGVSPVGAGYQLCACSAKAGNNQALTPNRGDTYANLLKKTPSVDHDAAVASQGPTAAWGIGYIDIAPFGRRAVTYELKAIAIVVVNALEGGPAGSATGRASDPVTVRGADTVAKLRLTLQPGTRTSTADAGAMPASLRFGITASAHPTPLAEIGIRAGADEPEPTVRLAKHPGIRFVDDDGVVLDEDAIGTRLRNRSALVDIDGLLRETPVLTLVVDMKAAGWSEVELGTFNEAHVGREAPEIDEQRRPKSY